MCGIIGCVGRPDAIDALVNGLENLEYRGYDSAGIAIQNGSGIEIEKRSGAVEQLKNAIRNDEFQGHVGIGHTRWSTHGPPTNANAHPHTDSTADVAVVHNGIIENYATLRDRLRREGHTFVSDTDTEVVPHLIQRYLDAGETTEWAFRRAIAEIEGSYAIAAMVRGEHAIFAARSGSPLVVGLEDDCYFLASDVPAFLEYTDDVIYLEDGDVAIVDADGISVTDLAGRPVRRRRTTVEWDPEQAAKGEFDHFMHKEIHEQPTAIAQAVEGRIDTDRGTITLEEFPEETFEWVQNVHLLACGTSYHAALYGAGLFNRAGVPARALRANEYGTYAPPADEDTLVVAVTQSGETADTLRALERATASGARSIAVTNVVGSTAARTADDTFLIRAGPEIGVAATKTFSSQAATLVLLAERVARDATGAGDLDLQSFLPALDRLSEDVATVLDRSEARKIARRYDDSEAYFFIGRGLAFPVALEGALKFKEITYEHAEGFPAGELKHGPLALVTPETPVFAIFTGTEDGKTLNNAEEADTRGAPIVAVAPDGHPATDIADAHLEIPRTHPALSGLLANVQLQLLSYHAAAIRDRPIDKPRNLAKSVTVE